MKKALADVNEKLKASDSHESVKIAVVCLFFFLQTWTSILKFCSMLVDGRKKNGF